MASFQDESDEEREENDIAAVISFDSMLVMKLLQSSQSIEETQALIDHVGKVEINIGDGLTLLHQAASNNRVDLIDYLCSKGHSTDVRTIAGETPLDQAAWKGSLDAIIMLLKHGADVDCQTKRGYSPLHRAAFYNHRRLAGILALAGADQKIRDSDGQTAYEVAVARGNDAIAETLKPMIYNGRDMTGIMYATNNPKHPNHRPEARAALFAIHDVENSLSAGGEEEEEGSDEEEEGSDDEEEEEEEEGSAGEEEEGNDEGEKVATGI